MSLNKKRSVGTWMPCAIGGRPSKYAEKVVVTQEGDNQDGELLFLIEQPTGMTAAELRAFAVWLASEYRK